MPMKESYFYSQLTPFIRTFGDVSLQICSKTSETLRFSCCSEVVVELFIKQLKQ